MKNRNYPCLSVFFVSFLCCLGTNFARAEKLFDFRFNEKGVLARSATDAKSSVPLTLQNAEGEASDLHGPGGSGVSGKPGDFAFDCTSATGMGRVPDKSPAAAPANYVGPVAITEQELDVLNGLQSYTIQGWFKTEAGMINGIARLVHVPSAYELGKTVLDLGANPNGGTLLFESKVPTPHRSAPINVRAIPQAFSMIDTWVFFALTYKDNEFTYYVGGTVDTVARAGVGEGEGALGNVATVLTIGNTPVRNRPFKGWIDNIRVYGSRDDASGALSISDLETLRVIDVRGL